MKTLFHISLILSSLIVVISGCSSKTGSEKEVENKLIKAEIVTTHGTIEILLYDETPLHKNNFIKIAKEGVLDSTLFHRVIEKFMIQAGDPNSKNASPADTLGSGDLPYTIPAEFVPSLFHKKGVVAAARTNNPERASSSTQFYIVQGIVLNDSLLTIAESRINGWLANYYTMHDPKNQALLESLLQANNDENQELSNQIMDSIYAMAKTYDGFEKYIIPEEHREVYKTIGGTPHLDQNYTIFGEVTKGIEVVDSIASVQTGAFDRPVEDVRILSVRILE